MLCNPTKVAAANCHALLPESSHLGDGTSIVCPLISSVVTKRTTSGIRNVRFQPYRLVGSRCWNAADARIQCVGCHDPHKGVVRGAALYDAKCLACHGVGMSAKPSKSQPGPACPVEKRQCVKCHMPKLTLPGAHSQFTDHQIRVARPGEDYPD